MTLRLAEMGSLVGSGNIDLLAEYGVEDLPVDKDNSTNNVAKLLRVLKVDFLVDGGHVPSSQLLGCE